MNGIKAFRATLKQDSPLSSFSKEWKLPTIKYLQYPQAIDIIEKEPVEFPFTVEKPEEIYVKKIDNSQTILNCTNLIKFSKEAEYQKLELNGLLRGSYIISGLGESDIFINVHKGVYWKKSHILKPFSLLENPEKAPMIKINSLKIEEGKDCNIKINVDSGKEKNWRLHLMLFRYLPNNVDELTKSLKSSAKEEIRERFFQQWENFYFSNRELSSELKYCFDRRQMEPYTGNTLEKPRLLLKRMFVRNTEEVAQTANKGTAYEEGHEKKKINLEQRRAMACCSELPRKIFDPVNKLSLYQNFIGKSPITQYNLLGNETGEIVVQIERSVLSEFATALIVAVGEKSIAHQLHPIPCEQEVNRDLSLIAPLSKEKFYSELRTTICLSKYDNLGIFL